MCYTMLHFLTKYLENLLSYLLFKAVLKNKKNAFVSENTLFSVNVCEIKGGRSLYGTDQLIQKCTGQLENV